MISLDPALGLRLLHLEQTSSTNAAALDAAEAGEAGDLVVLADVQTHGRGRQGRSWQAPPGTGLTFSILRRPPVDGAALPHWTLLAGVAVHLALKDKVPDLWLKWPNDLLVGDRKLGGILCEVCGEGPGSSGIVVGLGLNLRPPFEGWPADLLAATSIAETCTGHPWTRGEVFNAVLAAFVSLEQELVARGPGGLMTRYRESVAPLLGRRVVVELRGVPVEVDVTGVRDSGALQVVDGDGVVHDLLAGDVHLGTL